MAGKVAVQILEARDLMETDEDNSTVFCVCSFEKQEVRTRLVEFETSPEWNDMFIFDTTDKQCVLVFTLWEDCLSGKMRFLGRLAFHVNLSMLQEGQAVIHWYPLRPRVVGEKVKGELKVYLRYTSNKDAVTADDFVPLCLLGKGAFGKVLQVRKKDTNRIYAMKELTKSKLIDSDEVRGATTERELLRKVNHPLIVGLKFAFQTQHKLFLVLDYMPGGELFRLLRVEHKFTEARSKFYVIEIVLALEYLHKNNIIYRDLKPENILLGADGHIALTDFGLAKDNLPDGDVTYTICGTAEYLAPEVVDGRGYDKSVDWWTLGTLLFEMLTGKPQFLADSMPEIFNMILHHSITIPSGLSGECSGLLCGLLDRNPETRLGAGPTDAESIKAHPFFAGVSWKHYLSKEIEAPFKPNIKNPADTSYFDKRFTGASLQDSPQDGQIPESQQSQFLGFSYTAPGSVLSPESSKMRADPVSP
eukprot:TRINITY_DN2046_c0_g1_i7.p1 TRINITY_DN2046_c0_g1~~TRINITY_DN2046_c0_g1_i7.p1  ORF type:complete len:475 (-),score=128.58 TRINITY_DN2046_c0_g1_i7:81-1505(-)